MNTLTRTLETRARELPGSIHTTHTRGIAMKSEPPVSEPAVPLNSLGDGHHVELEPRTFADAQGQTRCGVTNSGPACAPARGRSHQFSTGLVEAACEHSNRVRPRNRRAGPVPKAGCRRCPSARLAGGRGGWTTTTLAPVATTRGEVMLAFARLAGGGGLSPFPRARDQWRSATGALP